MLVSSVPVHSADCCFPLQFHFVYRGALYSRYRIQAGFGVPVKLILFMLIQISEYHEPNNRLTLLT